MIFSHFLFFKIKMFFFHKYDHNEDNDEQHFTFKSVSKEDTLKAKEIRKAVIPLATIQLP